MSENPPLPATEGASPRHRTLDRWDAESILAALWESQLAAVAAVGPALGALARAAEAAAALLASAGGRLVYAGAGTSGRIAVQDGAELAPSFGWPDARLLLLLAGGAGAFGSAVEGAEDDTEAAAAALAGHDIGGKDVVIGVAASGGTPFTRALVEGAAARGALTVALANSAAAPLLGAARHPILLATGPEVIAGSTRLGAGTAQKVALNLFSSLLMTRLGHVHRGRMIDMQTGNAKLRARAARMLEDLSGCSAEAARAALAEARGRIKIALLVLHGLDAAAGEALLARHGGVLRHALATLPDPRRNAGR